jgi:acetyl-CoA carboxylase biotin carboxyl carrier protein
MTMAKSQSNEGKDIFSLERLRQLIDLMKEHDLGEIDLQQDAQRIRLTRGSLPTMTMPAVVASAPPAPSAPAAPLATPSDLEGPHIVTIKSPMVGTFYARPNPNSKNYVEVGSAIQPDTTICIIEAMKVFNEIPAEVRGKIVSVLVQNEEAVDFGRPLFKVDTRG